MHRRTLNVILLAGLALSLIGTGCKTTTAAACPACPTCPETPTAAVGPDAASVVVARIGDERVTLEQLTASAGKALKRLDSEQAEQRHELMRKALVDLIDERLVARTAQAAGKTPEAFLAERIAPEPVDEKLLQMAYRENAERIGRPYEEVAPMLRAEFEKRALAVAREALLADLREQTEVTLSLPEPERPRYEVPVAPGEPHRGPADAPVTIVEYSDFECPFCGRAAATMEALLERNAGKLRLVFRQFPLSFHRNAGKAAEATLCGQAQGKFWEMHDRLFTRQDALEVEQLKAAAGELGLDVQAFAACLDGGKMADAVDAQMKAGEQLGVHGTPAFFVNGILLTGALPIEDFQRVIDAELAR